MHSLLWLSNIPLYICTMASLSIHLSVNGHLDCFHVLAIVMGYMRLFQFCFPQGICPVVGFLDYMVVLFLVFKGISILFSIVALSIYIPNYSARRFPFLHTFSIIFVCSLFDDGHSDQYEMIPPL